MYFRTKRSGGFEYLQMVESHRVNGKPRQTVVATVGRLDVLKAYPANSTGCCDPAPG